MSTAVAGGLRGLAPAAKSCVGGLSQVWKCCGGCKRPAHVSGVCPPLTAAAAAGTWRGETNASGLHGVDVAVGLTRMLLQSVTMGRPDTTGWRVPLVKARACKVKELDPVVKRYRVRRDGGPWG